MRTKCHDFNFAGSALRGPMSNLLDEVGRRGSARHNSFATRGTPGTMNLLREASAGGMCLKAINPIGKEAPRSTGDQAARPQNQPTPRSWVGIR
jgi:hypothetical protein